MRLVVALALAAVLSPAARALDLMDVWRAATDQDAEFASARAAREAAGAQRDQAGALWRPNISVEGAAGWASSETTVRGAWFSAPGFGQTNGVGFDTSVTNGTSTRAALALRQPLLDRDRDVQQQQLLIAADATDIQWRDAQQSLILRSAERYFDVALAAEQLRLLHRQQAAVDKAYVEAQDRFRIGDRPVTDTHEAAARAAALRAERVAAETELELRKVALTDLSGLAIGAAPLPLPVAARDAEPLEDLPVWLDRAATGNPALQLAEARLRVAVQEARRTDAALSPTLDVVAKVARERLSGSGEFGSASNTANNGAIGLQLNVPLYTGGMRTAQQAEARARVGKASADVEVARRQSTLKARGAWLDLSAGTARIAALEAALAASTARLDATRVGLRAGDRTTLDLLNAENDVAAAEFELLRARTRVLLSRLALAALAGQLDEARLRQVNGMLQPLR
ncbi:MAG TPA: TolC family outer membrane protein [Caldimonas sp.]|nr:TolC family outer membrane protein [Caldimonas sp.]